MGIASPLGGLLAWLAQAIPKVKPLAAMQELGQTAGRIAESTVQVAGLTGTTLEQIERVAQVGSTSQEKSHQMVEVVQATLNGIERVGRQVEEFQHEIPSVV